MILLLIFLLVFSEGTPVLIFLGNGQLHAFRNGPLYVDVRIFPGKSALIIGMIEICTFVSELRMIRKHQKAMCKILRNKELLFVLCGKQDTKPFSIRFGSFSQVYRHIINLTGNHAHQLVLRVIDLKMKTAEHAFLEADWLS